MSFISHIQKDIARFKWFILSYMSLIVIASGLNLSNLKMTDNLILLIQLPILSFLVSFLSGLIGIVLIPLVIQEDPLVGTTAFWLTRPIARRDLLTAKMVFLFIFLVVFPLVFELSVMGMNGVSLKYIGLAIPEIIMKNTAFAVPLILLATLTSKLSRFVMVGISIYAGLWLLGVIYWIVSMVTGLGHSFSNQYAQFDYTLQLSKLVVSDIFTILVGSALIIHQYLTRNSFRTIILVILGYLLIGSIAMHFWRYDFLGLNQGIKEDISRLPSITTRFDTNHIIIKDNLRIVSNSPSMKTISVHLEETGNSQQAALLSKLTNPYVVFPDNSELNSSYFAPKIQTLSEGQLVTSLKSSDPHLKISAPSDGKMEYTDILNIPESSWNNYKGHQGTYIATAIYDIYDFKKAFTLPLQGGMKGTDGPEQVQIFDILEKPTGVTVVLTVKRENLLFDKDNEKNNPAEAFNQPFKNNYLLINIKDGEAFLPSVDNSSFGLDMIQGFISHQSRSMTRAKRLDFIAPDDTKIDQDWLKDAVLVRIDAVKIGQKRSLIKQENFIIPTKSTDDNE